MLFAAMLEAAALAPHAKLHDRVAQQPSRLAPMTGLGSKEQMRGSEWGTNADRRSVSFSPLLRTMAPADAWTDMPKAI